MVNGVEHGRKGVKIIEDGGRTPIHSHDGANAHPRCRCKTKMCERIWGELCERERVGIQKTIKTLHVNT